MRHERRFSRSLSGKLFLIFAGMGLLFILLVGGSMGRAFLNQFQTTIRPHVMQYLDYVQADLGTPPDRARAIELSHKLPITIQVIGPEGAWSSMGEPVDLSEMKIARRSEKEGKEYVYGRQNGREYLRVRDGVYTFAYSIPAERGIGRTVVPLLILMVILAMLYHTTRRLFAPLQTIKAGVERMGSGELDYRIKISRRDELSDLATSINTMADDIQQILDSKRQLLLAISHELRSPLTRAKVAANLVDDEAQRNEIEQELNELEKLIEELLETERLATRHEALHKQSVNMNTLAQDVLENLRSDIKPLLLLPSESIDAQVDPVRIKLLLRNLIENAVRHTPQDAAPPEVSLCFAPAAKIEGQPNRERGSIVLTVSDHGPGIAPEHLPHVTDAFYRADPARRRETGGYGLGLYLCRRIAEAHGGQLTVASTPPNGTQVTVLLPG